tara:strand:- start:14122 stop:15390 length:1269 start_codon:yes stop_codon:yes gene_type:complete
MDKKEVRIMSVTAVDIQQLEAFADRIFANVGIDVEFTKHFKDRVNSERNAKPIVPAELTRLFKQERKRYGKPIAQMGPDSEAVMRDLQTDINVPFALVLDKDNDELDLIAKTVMRKKDFDTPNRVFAVEDSPFRIGTRYEMPRKSVRPVPVIKEGATKKHPKEPGAYLMTHNGIEYKIARHLDDDEIHRGEWDIYSKGVSAFSGDSWEWVDTVTARWNAIARVKGLSENTEKDKIAFNWLSESRAYRTPRQLNGLKQSQLGEQLFEQLLALQILANSDPAYAARVSENIMKLQNWPGFRTSQPDLYNIIAIIMKPNKFKDRIAQDKVITIPELRLKRNLRAIAKREFQNSDYSYMMLMLQRNMVDFLPAPLIQMRRQIANWERVVPRDKNVIRDRLMLQMRKSGLQNEFYEFLRRTKTVKRR